MDEPRIVPFVSSVEAEENATFGQSAHPEMRAPCPGIDMPGVGVVPLEFLNSLHDSKDVEPASEVAEDANLPTSAPRREGLLAELVFAARILADAHVCVCDPRPDEPGAFRYCQECSMGALGAFEICHATSCRVGRVIRIINALFESDEAEMNSPSAQSAAQCFLRSVTLNGLFMSELLPLTVEMVTPRLAEIVECNGSPVATMHGDPETGKLRAQRIASDVNFCDWMWNGWIRELASNDRRSDQEMLVAIVQRRMLDESVTFGLRGTR